MSTYSVCANSARNSSEYELFECTNYQLFEESKEEEQRSRMFLIHILGITYGAVVAILYPAV